MSFFVFLTHGFKLPHVQSIFFWIIVIYKEFGRYRSDFPNLTLYCQSLKKKVDIISVILQYIFKKWNKTPIEESLYSLCVEIVNSSGEWTWASLEPHNHLYTKPTHSLSFGSGRFSTAQDFQNPKSNWIFNLNNFIGNNTIKLCHAMYFEKLSKKMVLAINKYKMI